MRSAATASGAGEPDRRERTDRIIATQADVAAAGSDLGEVMRLVCERARELIPADAASVVRSDAGEPRVVVSGSLAGAGAGEAPSLVAGLPGWMLAYDEPALCNDVAGDTRVDAALARRWGLGSLVAVPLRRGKVPVGVLAVLSSARNAFAEVDLDTLRLLSVVLSSAFSSASEVEAKRAQVEALGRYRTIFEGASIGIVRVAVNERSVEANPAMERMLGYAAAELAAMSFREYTHPDDVEENVALFEAMMAGELDSYRFEKRCYAKDGSLIWTQVTAALERDAEGKPEFVIAMMEDITKRKLAEEELQRHAELNAHQALHDTLTGLGNRRKLSLDLERDLGSDRDARALALFDLDGFKAYNDTFGHPAGDTLLARLAGRLAAAVDGGGAAYRMGGDEFCVVIRGERVDELLEAAKAAFREQGEGFTISCSCGTVRIPAEATTLESALQLADQRLYADKRESRPTDGLQPRDALLDLIADRSRELFSHVSAVAELAARTAARLDLSPEEVACARVAAQLHDIGKAAIPEAILSKSGPLDDEEWEFVKRHTVIGERILAAAPSLEKIAPIVRSSHERPDGSGYPDGLRIDEIPIGSRIIAVVDAFDAMVTGRPYKPARSIQEAIDELHRCAGDQFDPSITEAFISVVEGSARRHERGRHDRRIDPPPERGRPGGSPPDPARAPRATGRSRDARSSS